jgi:hypothetical protein
MMEILKQLNDVQAVCFTIIFVAFIWGIFK